MFLQALLHVPTGKILHVGSRPFGFKVMSRYRKEIRRTGRHGPPKSAETGFVTRRFSQRQGALVGIRNSSEGPGDVLALLL